MHISDLSMHRKPQLAQRGPTERLGVGKETPREMLWCTEWSSPVARATTIQYQAPERGWSFGLVLVSPGTHYNN
jgi:hypothetical protein